jgi:hypothetical protein
MFHFGIGDIKEHEMQPFGFILLIANTQFFITLCLTCTISPQGKWIGESQHTRQQLRMKWSHPEKESHHQPTG